MRHAGHAAAWADRPPQRSGRLRQRAPGGRDRPGGLRSLRRGSSSGFDGLYVDGKLAALLNLPQPAGILVQRIVKNSPAAALGLQAGHYALKIDDQNVVLGGDIILSVNGISVGGRNDAVEQIDRWVGRPKAGDPIRITILRAGKIVHLPAEGPAGTQTPGK